MGVLDKLYEFLKNAVNSAMDGSFQKMQIISQLNKSFEEQYLNGETNRLVKASITIGEQGFKHSMSVNYFRSGFLLIIQNDEYLKESEANEVAKYILMNQSFIKKLMSLGFDTLMVRGQSTDSIKFKMSDFANLDSYFLP